MNVDLNTDLNCDGYVMNIDVLYVISDGVNEGMLIGANRR